MQLLEGGIKEVPVCADLLVGYNRSEYLHAVDNILVLFLQQQSQLGKPFSTARVKPFVMEFPPSVSRLPAYFAVMRKDRQTWRQRSKLLLSPRLRQSSAAARNCISHQMLISSNQFEA